MSVEPAPLHELHRVEDAAVGEPSDVVHRYDARMFEQREDPRLPEHPLRELSRAVGDLENLERDAAGERNVFGQIDGAHSPPAYRGEEPVALRQIGGRRRRAQPLESVVGKPDHSGSIPSRERASSRYSSGVAHIWASFSSTR